MRRGIRENLLHEVSETIDDISVGITIIKDMCDSEEQTLENIKRELEKFLETLT